MLLFKRSFFVAEQNEKINEHGAQKTDNPCCFKYLSSLPVKFLTQYSDQDEYNANRQCEGIDSFHRIILISITHSADKAAIAALSAAILQVYNRPCGSWQPADKCYLQYKTYDPS